MRKQIILLGFFCLIAVSPAAAQTDEAWLAWTGCWRAEGDMSGRALCIVPDGAGIRMITTVGGAIESESRVIANGQPRAIDQEGCSGTETAIWSADRQRVFVNADLNCGNQVRRKLSGIFAMLGPSQWASIQSITSGGAERMHTVRYVEVDRTDVPDEIAQALRDNRLARETVRIAAAARLDLTDVREAVMKVEAAAVEGWITTVGQAFDLDASALIELADAGVPGSVIDVLIAVSHPGHFAVREERASERDTRRRPGGGCYDAYWTDPYDPFGYRYTPYSYGCGGGGWGLYPRWGGYYGGGYYGGGTVIVIDKGVERTRGKVTKEGYKSGRRTNGDSGVGSNPSIPSSTSSTGRSSGSSDSDSRSGSSSGSSRKAKPRGT